VAHDPVGQSPCQCGIKHVAADRLVVAPDCGMKYMPRHVAFGKLKAMCDAAATVRKEIS
jgi:5-methyltetrahydropteroyltriglutamate--homocysteine methyltransferase